MRQSNWAEIWSQLSSSSQETPAGQKREGDAWGKLARHVDASTRQRWENPDCLMQFVLDSLGPGDTVLDIGAGTGGWSIPIARKARRVTAIEPSSEMLCVLRDNTAAEGLSNVVAVRSRWEEAEVEMHDIALCSHAMYQSPDLVSFALKMGRHARRRCYLVMRVPSREGVIGELSERIFGQWHDSPNFIIGYNLLLSMGVYANVLIDPALRPWSSQTLEDAMTRAKRLLRLAQTSAFDDLIRSTLSQRLAFKGDRYEWPDGKQSALVWWDTTESSGGKMDRSLEGNQQPE